MLPIDTKEFFSRLTAKEGPDSSLYQAILHEMRGVAARYIPKELRYQASLTEIVAEGVQQAVMGLRDKGSGLVGDDRERFLKLVKTTVARRAKDHFRKATAQSRTQQNVPQTTSSNSYPQMVAGGPDPANQAAAKELLDLIRIELMRYEPPAKRFACLFFLFGQMKVADITKSLQAYEASLRETDPQAAEAFQCCKSPHTIANWIKQAMKMIDDKFGPL